MTYYKIIICGTDPNDTWDLIATTEPEATEIIKEMTSKQWACIEEPLYPMSYYPSTKVLYFKKPDEKLYINTSLITTVRLIKITDEELKEEKS